MKIAVCQLITPNIDVFAKYSVASILEYCKQHSYDYYIQRDRLIEEMHINWSKIQLLQNLLESSYDYLVLFDADIILTDTTRPINQFIEENNTTIWMPEDTHLLIKNRPNAGFIVLKNDSIGKELIEKWLEAAFKDQVLADKHPRNQRIFWKYVMPNFQTHLQLVSREMVSKYFYGLNDFLGNGKFALHFDYTTPKIRAKFMKRVLGKYQNMSRLMRAEDTLKSKAGLISVAIP